MQGKTIAHIMRIRVIRLKWDECKSRCAGFIVAGKHDSHRIQAHDSQVCAVICSDTQRISIPLQVLSYGNKLR